MRACVFSEEWIRERATVIDVTQRSEDGAIIKALMRRVRAPDAASSRPGDRTLQRGGDRLVALVSVRQVAAIARVAVLTFPPSGLALPSGK
jgi:hypothetical protein